MSVTYRPGAFYCDVAPFDGRFLFVYEQGLAVVCEFDLSEVWRTAIPEKLLFLRCDVVNGLLHAIGQAHDSGNALLVNARGVVSLGPTFGVQPVAIDGTYAYIVRSPQKYDRINLLNGETQSLPHGIPGSSQGIRDVVNGEIRWADNSHFGTFGGLVLHDYSTRGAVTVGQCDPDQIAGVVNGQRFTAIPNAAFEPHVVEGQGRYAICARTPQGAAFTIVPPYPSFNGAPVPPPPPPPPPPPRPEPTPVPDFPAAVKAIRDRYVGRFPVPQGHGPEDFDPATGGASGVFEDKARVWVRGLAEQVRFETRDARWGVKNAGGGRPQSKDSLTFNADRLWNYDLLSGVGTGHPTLVPTPAAEDITGQVFIAVDPVDHLGDAPAPPDPGPIPPPSGDLEARVARLEAQLRAIHGATA